MPPTINKEVSRRSVLKKGCTLGAISWGVGRKSVAKDYEKIAIDFVDVGDRTVVEKLVPEPWWESVKRARKIRRKLSKRYSGVPEVECVSRSVSNELVAGKRKHMIVVSVLNQDELQENVPDRVDGFPVTVEEVERPKPDVLEPNERLSSSSCYTDMYDPVPGGVQLNSPSASPPYISACVPAKDEDNNEGMVTCSHYWNDCEEDISNSKLYIENSGGSVSKYIGSVSQWSMKDDWVFAVTDQNTEVGLKGEIVNTNRDVRGHVTRNGLETLLSGKSTNINKGVDTCRTTGPLTNLDSTANRCKADNESNNYCKLDIETNSGDSGSPHYHTYYDPNFSEYYDAIIGVHHGSTSSGTAWASMAYKMYENKGITFGV